MRKALWIAMFLFAASGLHGEAGAIGGLISGVVFDAPSRSLRPVVGVPGAAYLGQPVTRGFDAVSVAPDGRQAIVLAAGRLYWMSDVLAGLPARELAEDVGPWELAAWRKDSSKVALSAGGRLLTASADGRIVPLSLESVPGATSSLAVADDGSVLAGVAGAGVYLLEEGAAPVLVAALADPVSIAAAGDRVWVADRASGQVLEIRRYREAPELILFAGAGQGVSDPVAVALSRRGAALWVADAAGRKTIRFDLATGEPAGQVNLDFEPARLEALGAAGFVLNEHAGHGEALQVLVEDSAPGVYFVPAPTLGEE